MLENDLAFDGARIARVRLFRDDGVRFENRLDAFETDRAQPYAPVLDLLRVLATTASPALAAHYFAPAAAELVALFPELRAIFPEAKPRAASDPEDDRRRLFPSLGEAAASHLG